MTGRRKFSILLGLLIMIPCLARESKHELKIQGKPDFSGTWTLDMTSSRFDVPKSGMVYDSLTLIISHHDPKLELVRKIAKKKKQWTQNLIYYTDRRGETNPSFNQNETVQSKTYWEANTLITKGTASMPLAGDVIMSDTSDRWELSADGRTLTQVSSYKHFRSKFGASGFAFTEQNITKVFIKIH